MERWMRAPAACRKAAAGLLVALALALPGAAETLDATAADELVRQSYFEGLPLARAAQIGEAGAAHLVALLADPSEAEHHANILVALAACERAGAYEAISAWAFLPRSGEVERGTFRAWQALPHALGLLAQRDGRAVSLLASQLGAEAPGWTFRHHDGERIARLTRRGAALGLARSGKPEADAALRNAEARQHADPSFRAHLAEARASLREQSRRQPR